MKRMRTFAQKAVKVASGLSLLVGLAVVMSCSKEKDDLGSRIKGKWAITHVQLQKNDIWNEWPGGKASVEFDGEGHCLLDFFGTVSDTASYEVKGKKILLHHQDNQTQVIEILQSEHDTHEIAFYNDSTKNTATNYRLSRIPTTEDEAQRLLVGQWLWTGEQVAHYYAHEEDLYEEETYFEITEDGVLYLIFKIRSDAKDGEWYSDYKDKYVGYFLTKRPVVIESKDDNPACGTINIGVDVQLKYEHLTATSVSVGFGNDSQKYVRAPHKINFTEIKRPF